MNSIAEVVQSKQFGFRGFFQQVKHPERRADGAARRLPLRWRRLVGRLAVEGDREWQALVGVLGRPEWALDPALVRVDGRLRRQQEIDRHLGEWTRQRTYYDVMHMLQAAGVAAAPCLDVHELLVDPQMAERGLLVELDHPEVGPRMVVGLPGRFSGTPKWNLRRSPLFGEHNEQVYTEQFGLSHVELRRLMDEQVIY